MSGVNETQSEKMRNVVDGLLEEEEEEEGLMKWRIIMIITEDTLLNCCPFYKTHSLLPFPRRTERMLNQHVEEEGTTSLFAFSL